MTYRVVKKAEPIAARMVGHAEAEHVAVHALYKRSTGMQVNQNVFMTGSGELGLSQVS